MRAVVARRRAGAARLHFDDLDLKQGPVALPMRLVLVDRVVLVRHEDRARRLLRRHHIDRGSAKKVVRASRIPAKT